MPRERTHDRNRAIFAAFLAGETAARLAEAYALAPASIVAIITFEKHKVEVSEDRFYQQLRTSLEPPFPQSPTLPIS